MLNDMEKVTFDSPSVHSYLTILQSVVTRMATNSSSCKTWCVSLVSAIIVIVAEKTEPDYVWISLIPIVLFLLLDSYYLAIERQFRAVYNDFIRKLHFSTATVEDVFFVAPRTGVTATSWAILCACGSIAIWPFYGLLAFMLFLVRILVL